MNKTAIKNYAIWARVQLIESAKQRAFEYEITENGENKIGLDTVGGRPLTDTEKEQRDQLIIEIDQNGKIREENYLTYGLIRFLVSFWMLPNFIINFLFIIYYLLVCVIYLISIINNLRKTL